MLNSRSRAKIDSNGVLKEERRERVNERQRKIRRRRRLFVFFKFINGRG